MSAAPEAHPGTAADLAEQAARRGARWRLLGRLLVSEPGPEELALARSLPSMAVALHDDRGLRSDYHRVLLAGVACYQSVFAGRDAQLGATDPALLAIYRRFDVRWDAERVAAGDQLGVQLLAYARLCDLEAEAWADDRPDRAAQLVETERELLANHLGSWLPAATEAIGRAGAGTAYAALTELCDEAFAAEAERLRPAAQHPGMPEVGPVEPDRPQGGAGRVARRLLAPARAGGYLLAQDVAPAAALLDVAWRPSDTRSRLRHVVDAAMAQDRLGAIAEAFAPVVRGWAVRWRDRRDATPGAWRTFESLRRRAEDTLGWLDGLADLRAAGPVTLVVGSPVRQAAVLAALSAGGVAVTTDAAPAEVRADVDVLVTVSAGAAERWEGTPPPGAVERTGIGT